MDDSKAKWLRVKEGLKSRVANLTLSCADISAVIGAWSSFDATLLKNPTGNDQVDQVVGARAHLFLTAFVVSYGRMFCGEGWHLQKKDPYVLPHEVRLHEYLMELRHEMVAHSRRDRRRPRIVPVGYDSAGRTRFTLRADVLEWCQPEPGIDVQARLERLESVLQAEANAAFAALLKHCPDQPPPEKAVLIEDF